MSSKCEIKLEECATYERRLQIAQLRYQAAKERAAIARDNAKVAWNARQAARTDMNHEYEIIQSAKDSYVRELKGKYSDTIDEEYAHLKSLREEADAEHFKMQESREQAKAAYRRGDKFYASIYSNEDYRHKKRRDELNKEANELGRRLKETKKVIKSKISQIDASAYLVAKMKFEKAKVNWELAKAELDCFKGLCKTYKAALDAMKTEYHEDQLEREEILNKAGLKGSERETAKIVKKADGSIHVYYGGFGEGDGLGHGHAELDESGKKIFNRDALT